MTFFEVLPPSRFFLSQTFVTLLLIYQISYRLINNTRLILLDSSWRIIFHLLTVLQVITLYVQAAFRSKKYKNYERFNNDFFNDLKFFYLGEDHTIKKLELCNFDKNKRIPPWEGQEDETNDFNGNCLWIGSLYSFCSPRNYPASFYVDLWLQFVRN